MRSERLTRQELSWLLTQEARSAADRLRKGVAILSAPETRADSPEPTSAVEPALDALDDAMTMLASLHTGSAARGRRGRIDLAALLWDVAPGARVSIEPGGGTEVFGDEAELRRMLQVLVSAASPSGANSDNSAPEIAIRREGLDVRVSVTLGPDSSASAAPERAWLSRMAIRYGGRLDLEGATESMLLPADGATDRRELESLRRELEAAQQQGEAYARELAAVFSHAHGEGPPSSFPPPPPSSSGLVIFRAACAGLSAELSGLFAGVAEDTATLRTEGSELASRLGRLGELPLDEATEDADLSAIAREGARGAGARASRRGVTVVAEIPDGARSDTKPTATALLVPILIDDAVSATADGGTVRVELLSRPDGIVVLTIDDGKKVKSERPASGAGAMDPGADRRPAGIAFLAAQALTNHVGARLALGSAPGGGTRTTLLFPKRLA